MPCNKMVRPKVARYESVSTRWRRRPWCAGRNSLRYDRLPMETFPSVNSPPVTTLPLYLSSPADDDYPAVSFKLPVMTDYPTPIPRHP